MACVADGVIVGSAIVKIIAEHGNEAGPRVYQYVKEMTESLR
jgi:tryptophan synthase alpha chain